MNPLNKLTIQATPKEGEIEKHVKSLIVRDLFNLNWDLQQNGSILTITPPKEYNKDIVKKSMHFKREEILASAQPWINKHESLLKSNLATGMQAFSSPIIPSI